MRGSEERKKGDETKRRLRMEEAGRGWVRMGEERIKDGQQIGG